MSANDSSSDCKQNEIMELRAKLQDRKLNKNIQKKRQLVKKVIEYMSCGIDVTSLFSPMIIAGNTRDIIIKKMIYSYITHCAKVTPDLALLTLCTLMRDSRDDHPVIRGLALRTLCGFELEYMSEYLVSPIQNGLTDSSSYVRKIAVLCCTKLYQVSPELAEESDLINTLYNMIADENDLVVINTIYALNEILSDEGGMAVNAKLIHYLLDKLHAFDEWGKIVVLNLLTEKYQPSSLQQRYEIFYILKAMNFDVADCYLRIMQKILRSQVIPIDIHRLIKSYCKMVMENSEFANRIQEICIMLLNILHGRKWLNHTNSSLVLAIIKLFSKLTKRLNLNCLSQQFYYRIRNPLLTLISNTNYSLAYLAFQEVLLLIEENRNFLACDYKFFFLKYNDPIYIKKIKLKCLAELLNASNKTNILCEISEYVLMEEKEICHLSNECIVQSNAVPNKIKDSVIKSVEKSNIELKSNPKCTAKDYQKMWKRIKYDGCVTKIKGIIENENSVKYIEIIANRNYFSTMAVGTVKGTFKIYFYAQDKDDNLYYVECLINLETLQFDVTCKSQINADIIASKFMEILCCILK